MILLAPQSILANLVKTSGPNAHPRATQANTTLSKIDEGIQASEKPLLDMAALKQSQLDLIFSLRSSDQN